MNRTRNILYNASFALNCLLLFLVLFESRLQLPALVQVAGRMHPLVLHFPLVLFLLALLWEGVASTRKVPILNQSGDFLLLAAALTSVVAALTGLFLSREQGYDEQLLSGHKWGGIALSLLALLLYSLRNWMRSHSLVLRCTAVLGGALLVFTGHQGASLTHGDGFLSEPLVAATPATVPIEEAQVFPHLVQPILEAKCVQCHNDKKKKGGLLMTSFAALEKGGKSGALWDTADAGGGLLLKRIHLPLNEKKHMPPKGKPQLTDEELAILHQWIRKGAPESTPIREFPEQDSLRQMAAARLRSAASEDFQFAAANPGLVQKLNTNYCVVQPIATGSAALAVSFFSASQFQAQKLGELKQVKEQLVSLNLNGMPVKDADLATVGALHALRKLNLGFTQVSGAGLDKLHNLKELRQLTLSGTAAGPAIGTLLPHLPKLNRLVLWQSSFSAAQLTALQTSFPKTHIETGFTGDTVTIRLNPPVVVNEASVIREPEALTLKHVIKGTEIRYTLDGTEPDSIRSPVFKGKVMVDRSMVVKAKAFKKGWISSLVTEKHFFRAGILPDSIRLLSLPDPQYRGNGGASLMDTKKGDLNFRSGLWLGYKDKPLEALIYLGEPRQVSSVSLSCLVDVNSYIMPAYKVSVWGSNGNGKYRLLASIQPPQPQMAAGSLLAGVDLSFKPQEVSSLKLLVEPVAKLPGWHPGKGQKGWVFLDEIFIN